MARTNGSSGRALRIAIIGAGPGGLCMGIRLKGAGIESFEILEKAAGVGGTWHHNRYPGCACDVPSHLYSFSFEPKRDWSRPYAPQPEILAYLEHVAEKYGLLAHCRFGDAVERARWDEAHAHWTLELASGRSLEADVVVSALGLFNDVAVPDLPGLDAFAGTLFHSARWKRDHDLAGETVGVIGSAASAVQLVPEIVKQAGHVHLFQRTPNWVGPKEDTPYTDEQLERFRADPAFAQAVREQIFEGFGGPGLFERVRPDMEAACLAAMAVVKDPALRARLLPDHPWGCKRPLFSNDYYPAFNRPNLELVSERIERVTPTGIRTRDGRERRLDTLILATGFATTKFLSAIDVRGRGGLSIADAWKDGAQAYKGVTTAGFPNLFMLYGPNTNSDSILMMLEYQADHVLRQIQRIAREGLAWIDVRPDAMAAYNDAIQREIAKVELWQAGCTDYYRAPSGRNVTQWPDSMPAMERALASLDPEAYEVAPA
ncbi:MAG TPA: NAD(P)/FAD-dependent oxidoreductase [Myxococcota bacterium]|nr:NAD(P)/FAD-dependent oxidoreductase [Myxococcota bacterium]